jgi:hypothetical protein
MEAERKAVETNQKTKCNTQGKQAGGAEGNLRRRPESKIQSTTTKLKAR